jgi:hypothetical protein
MDIVRARGQDPETCRELFILAAEVLGVAAVSVGVSRLKPAAPTVERATVRTDTVKRDPMLRQMRGDAPDSGGDRGHRCSHSYAIPGAFERSWKAI